MSGLADRVHDRSRPAEERHSRASAKMMLVTDPITELGVEIVSMWRTGRADMRKLAREIHPRLDPAGYLLFSTLGRSTDPVTIAKLRVELGEEKSTLSRQIDALVKLALAERRTDPSDSRARLIALTPDGRHRFNALRSRNAETWRRNLSEWQAEEVRELTRLLGKLRVSNHPTTEP